MAPRSITITLTGKSSVLSAQFYPSIKLKEEDADNRRPVRRGDYYMGLVDFEAYNSVPNIDETNNLFYYGEEVLTIPVGSYEITDIEAYLKSKLGDENIKIKANNNTLQSVILSNEAVDFTKPNTIGPSLGFSSRILKERIEHTSDRPVDLVRLNVIRIECDVVSGTFINGTDDHVIYQFAPTTSPGYKIVEVPHNVIYCLVDKEDIDRITLRLTDQEGRLLNFRGETITIRLHLVFKEF